MKNILRIIGLCFFATSCCTTPSGSVPECENNDYFNFKLLSSNGDDLFGGLNPKYQLEQLKVYTITGSKRVDATLINRYESLVALISPSFDEGIIEINNVAKDTIYFSLRINEDKCCGKEAKIDKVVLDNKEIDYHYFNTIEIVIVD